MSKQKNIPVNKVQKFGHIDRHLNDLPERKGNERKERKKERKGQTTMALSVTQYTDFTKAFFTFKISYGLTVNSAALKRVPCKPYGILTVNNALQQSVHCVTNSATCSPVQCNQQAAAAAAAQSVSPSSSRTTNSDCRSVRPRKVSPKLRKKFEVHLILTRKGGGILN